MLKHHRPFPDGATSLRPSYRQIKSTQNNRVERLWVEVNGRIAYPIRYAMEYIENTGMVDINDNHHQFCISVVLRSLVRHMLSDFVSHWNNHRISASESPKNVLFQTCAFP